MAETSLNATFFAFRKREQGGVLLAAGVTYGIGLIVLTAAFFGAIWALLGADFFTWSQHMAAEGGKGGAQELPPNFGRIFLIFPLEMLWIFGIFILLAAFESACLRWMIRGERSGPLNLCFGADMWRVYGAYWVWFLYFVGTGILFFIVMLILGVIAGAAGKGSEVATGLIVFGGVVVWMLGWIYTSVRLAPAAATSVGVGRFAPLTAWTVTRGRFWALFGAFLLLSLIYFLAVLVVGGIAMGAFYASIFSHVDWSTAQSDPSAAARAYQAANLAALRDLLANPTSIALYVIGQIAIQAVGVVLYVLYFGVNARAVQAALEEGKITQEPVAA